MDTDDKNESNLEDSTETGLDPGEAVSADMIAAETDTTANDAPETTDVVNLATSETDSPSLEKTSAQPNLDGEGDPAVALNGAPAQDSGELDTKEAEAAAKPPISLKHEQWKVEATRFFKVVDAVLAEKEAIKLEWVGKKVQHEFVTAWKVESNRAFKLAVMLRRRQLSGKFGGKIIA
jgi:hypothetical protein